MSKPIRARLPDALYEAAISGRGPVSDRVRYLIELGLITEALIQSSRAPVQLPFQDRAGPLPVDPNRSPAPTVVPRVESIVEAPSASQPINEAPAVPVRRFKSDPDPFGDHVTPIGRYIVNDDTR